MVLKRDFGSKIQEYSFRWELNSAEFFYFHQKRIWATVEFTARYPFAPLNQLLKKWKLDEYSRPMDNNNLFFGELYLRNLLLDARSVKNICYWKLKSNAYTAFESWRSLHRTKKLLNPNKSMNVIPSHYVT